VTRRVSFDPDTLERAVIVLEAAGYTVNTVTPGMLARGFVLACYRAVDDDGHLLEAAELGHVAHYGACYLWGGVPDSSPPAWSQKDVRARLETALSRWCLEVATAPDGLKQDTLHRRSYTIGGLVGSGQVQEHEAIERLERAGLESGLDAGRVRSTVKRSLERGSREPWTLEDRPANSGNPELGQSWIASKETLSWTQEAELRQSNTQQGGW
jgi:hypothetical protein